MSVGKEPLKVLVLLYMNILDLCQSSFLSPLFKIYFWQTSGFALALGNIIHGLSVCGHGKAEDLGNRLLPAWIKTVLTEVEGTSCMLFYIFIKEKEPLYWTIYRCCHKSLTIKKKGSIKWDNVLLMPYKWYIPLTIVVVFLFFFNWLFC